MYGNIQSAENLYGSRSWERKLLEDTDLILPPCLVLPKESAEECADQKIRRLLSSNPDILEWKLSLDSAELPKEKIFKASDYPLALEEYTFEFNDRKVRGKLNEFEALIKFGGIIVAVPPCKTYRQTNILMRIDPDMDWRMEGAMDVLNTWDRKVAGYMIPQQSLSISFCQEIASTVRNALFQQKLYGFFDIEVKTFQINGRRIMWGCGLKPYITMEYAAFNYSLAVLDSDFKEGQIVFDNVNAQKRKLRYMDSIRYMDTRVVHEKNFTASDTFTVSKSEAVKNVVYLVGLEHSGFENMNIDVISALCHDSGMEFDYRWKKGTLVSRLDRPLSMIAVTENMQSSIELALWNMMVLNQVGFCGFF